MMAKYDKFINHGWVTDCGVRKMACLLESIGKMTIGILLVNNGTSSFKSDKMAAILS